MFSVLPDPLLSATRGAIGVCTAWAMIAATALPLSAQDAPVTEMATSPAPQTAPETGEKIDMARIEQAYAQGDFETVRTGLAHLAAEDGSALAQYRYGRVLIEGLGGPRDLEQAQVWLERAVAQDHLGAATLLARLILSVAPDQSERGVQLVSQAAARGDAEAQYILATLALDGIGMAQDDDVAFRWLLAAAEQGYTKAQFRLARAYAEGRGTPSDNTRALRWLTAAAEANHTEAQFFLANAYESGTGGVDINLPEAMKWYRRAAEAGMPIAQRALGTAYLTGKAGTTDPEQAQHWLVAAAEAGDIGAMNNLGQAYATGTVLSANDEQAFHWYNRAADAEMPRAIAMIAQYYEQGRGVAPDMAEAIKLYRRAADAGQTSAGLRLGQLAISGALDGAVAPQRQVAWVTQLAQSDIAPDNDGAIAWLGARADQSMVGAQSALGLILIDRGADTERALGLLEQAATAGDIAAQFTLGQGYATGAHGLALDYVPAHAWLNIATTGGHPEAAEMRDLIAQLMTPEQIAEAQTKVRMFYATEPNRTPQTQQTVTVE